ncbi:MAG TPA: ABC transporter permease, partial [Bryobacteraceae bacterium]
MTSAAAIFSLALGFGACLAAFQLVNALLLRPLPITEPDRLYALSRREFPGSSVPIVHDNWQYPLLRDMRDAVADQAALIAISESERVEIAFRSDREMERVRVQYVSGNTFGSFGLPAAAGRLLSQRDDLKPGTHPVAVLSYDYWSRRFAQAPDIIGRTFRMTNNLTGTRIYQIVGVVGDGFTGTEPGNVVDIFLPSMMHWGISFPEWSLF